MKKKKKPKQYRKLMRHPAVPGRMLVQERQTSFVRRDRTVGVMFDFVYKANISAMSAVVYIGLLLCCLNNMAVGAELSQPQHVTLITLNTNYTLSWDWNQSLADSHAVTFTTQYIGRHRLKKKSQIWITACEETSQRLCDLTVFKLHYLGIYVLRVRASSNGRHSDWVQKEFCPDSDADLGPPTKVKLAPAVSDLDIFITDPLSSTNETMKDHVPMLYYHIVYWERSAETQTQTLSKSANLVTLSNLTAWTWYCVKVQTRYDFYNKSSSFTSPQCIRTEGNIPWWQIVLYFMASLVLGFLVVLLSLYGSFWCYKTVKATLFPSSQLPTQLRKYLCDSPGSDVPRLLSQDPESELLCDKVTVCEEPTLLEIHSSPPEALLGPLSGLDPDNSKHSRQDSSSGDSGVFSTGGSSNMQEPSSSHSSTGDKHLEPSPTDLEQVKMKDVAVGRSQFLLTDEGIVDECV